jgi:2-polyprenyl-3-methyl-5-hydroxy-6-metoxy-1,4-benzoquinol methylase
VKSYEEIEGIIAGFGIVDEKTNIEWANKTRAKIHDGTFDTNELNALHPDHIDNRAFWKVIDEKFNHSVMGNNSKDFLKEKNVDLINKNNLIYAETSGVLCFTGLPVKDEANHHILEIGAGYGNIRDYMKARLPLAKYVAVDVNPKIPEAVQAKADGTLPDELKEAGKYSHIISSNVFQHLSQNQQFSYIRDAYTLLKSGGMFSFTFSKSVLHNDSVIHYGQVILLPPEEVVIGYVKMLGFQEMSRTVNAKGNIGLNLWKP